MISDYFFPAKMKDEKAQEVVKDRIDALKKFIAEWISWPTLSNWRTVSIRTCFNNDGENHDRFYMNTKAYDEMKQRWFEDTKVKIDDYDWRYLLYMVVKDMGFNVGYANGTMGICMDIPPVVAKYK